jgi:uncharacterized protein involved in exopolysaccharide biosynthesis
MTGDAMSSRDPFAGVAGLLPRALRAWWVALVAFGLGLGGTAAWVLATKRTYRSEAVIVYERPIVASVGGLSVDG